MNAGTTTTRRLDVALILFAAAALCAAAVLIVTAWRAASDPLPHDLASLGRRTEQATPAACEQVLSEHIRPMLAAHGGGGVQVVCVERIDSSGDPQHQIWGMTRAGGTRIEISTEAGISVARMAATAVHEATHAVVEHDPKLRAAVITEGGTGLYRGPHYETSPAESFADGVAAMLLPDRPAGIIQPWSVERVQKVLDRAHVSMRNS